MVGAVSLLCAFPFAGRTLAQQPPPISREEFEYQLSKLELDANQVEAVKAIYGRLVEEHNDAYEALLAFHGWYHDLTMGIIVETSELQEALSGDIDRSNEMEDEESARLTAEYFESLSRVAT